MSCTLSELRNKEVINKQNGARIGYVDDLEVDTRNARICALVIYGRLKLFGLLGRKDDLIIPWDDISLVGEDTILVSSARNNRRKHHRKGFFRQK